VTAAQPPVVAVGDRVVMTSGNHARRLSAKHGTVVKVGRVWINVQPDGVLGDFTYRYRLDTQTDGSPYTSAARFYTLDQWEQKQRRDDAVQYLHDQGISIGFDSPWRGREIELADLLRAHLAGIAGGGA